MSARRVRQFVILALIASATILQQHTPASASDVTFANRSLGATGGAAYITHGDLDNDGDEDALTANTTSNAIGVFLNDGGSPPTFAATTVGIGDPTSVNVADVDGDGLLDMIANARSSSSVLWFENDGTPADGGWTSHTVTSAVAGVFTVFPGDINGDGDVDIVSTGHGDDKVSWHENDGSPTDGGWTTRTVFDWSGTNPHAVSAADLDGDGDVDVLGGAQSDTTLRWFENNGADPPAWTPRSAGSAAFSPFVMAADVNLDGEMDVLSVSLNDSSAYWYQSNGATPPAFTQRLITNGGARGLDVADIDGDGDNDVAVADHASSSIDWFENTGGTPPTWQERSLQGINNAHGVIAVDLDDDTDTDIAGVGFFHATAFWHENFGNTFPLLYVSDGDLMEGDGGGTTPFNIPVSLLEPAPAGGVSFDYATVAGTATSGADFVHTAGSGTIPAGENLTSIEVQVVADGIDEPTEEFVLRLSNVTNANAGDLDGNLSILDDDPLQVSANDASSPEGDDVEFTVSLSQAATDTVVVDYTTADGTAGSGDYAGETDDVTIPAGQTSATVAISTTEDLIDEPNETFALDLTGVTGPAGVGIEIIDDGQGTITDDDGTPQLSINDPTVTEGGQAAFTVEASNPTTTDITVTGNTGNGTATSNFGADFTGLSDQTFTIPAGSTTSNTINVQTTNDNIDEADETFKMLLSDPSANASLGELEGVATITDNDDAPVITVSDPSGLEDEFGAGNYTFTLSATRTKSTSFSVDVATSDGTAIAPDDYTGVDTTVTWTPGQQFKTVSIPAIVADDIDEPNETFTLDLTNAVGATVGDDQGIGTITDDDGAPSLTINDPTVTEGVQAGFVVTASNPSATDITVTGNTSNGTADDADYAPEVDVTFTIPAGSTTSDTIDVATTNDAIDELSETFTMDLSGESANATLEETQGTATINDDDLAPTLSFALAEVKQKEGKKGTTREFIFTVNKSGQTDQAVTVDFVTVDGSAKAPKDYTSTTGILEFDPNETSETITVTVIGDRKVEKTEKFTVLLSNPVNATITGTNPAVGKIKNDDR
jgi:hypothetical protein